MNKNNFLKKIFFRHLSQDLLIDVLIFEPQLPRETDAVPQTALDLEKDDHLRNQMLSTTTTLGREREPQRAPSAIFAPDVMEPTGPQSSMPRLAHQADPIYNSPSGAREEASRTKMRGTDEHERHGEGAPHRRRRPQRPGSPR